MNILFLYGATQTFTNTVYEHVNCFAQYSRNKFYYCHQDQNQAFDVDLSRFDVVIMHYSVRLPYDQVPEPAVAALERYAGLKVLFIQDEYDHTYRAWYWIKRLGFQLVFTVVPPEGIAKVYPPEEFPGVRFVSNLTGYVPDERPLLEPLPPPSSRKIFVGYRGRRLPIRYGQLGQEKIEIGRHLKYVCKSNRIPHDIEWTEEARIYGPKWYEFLASCRSTLGSESGSNVFDWDGTLLSSIEGFKRKNRRATDDDTYRSVVQPREIPDLMNQVSPRVFEAILLRTALLLYEGNYSGVVIPMRHYIPVKKDGSNLDEVLTLLQDDKFIDDMTERAYQEIILSGKFSYRAFVQKIDDEIVACRALLPEKLSAGSPSCVAGVDGIALTPLTTSPIRALPEAPPTPPGIVTKGLTYIGVVIVWRRLPESTRSRIRPLLHQWRRLRLSIYSRGKHLLLNGKWLLLNGVYRVWGSLPGAVKDQVRRLFKRHPKNSESELR